MLEYLKEIDWVNIARMAGLSIAVVIGQIIIYKLIIRLFKKHINPFILKKSKDSFKGLKFRNYTLITPAWLVHTGFFFSKLVMYAALLFSLYASITLLFGIYPGTRNFAMTLFYGLANPFLSILDSFVSYIPNLLRIIVLVFIARYLIKFVKFLMKEIETGRLVIKGFYPDWASATFNLFRLLTYTFMAVLIFPLLPQSETDIFRGISVFLGVLLSLGSTTIISNAVAGLVLTYMRSFKLGDRVKIGEVVGDVVEKTPFAVRIQTNKKEVVTVPNSTLLSSNVVNYSTSGNEKAGVIISLPITVGYDVPRQRAIGFLTDAAKKTENVLHDPAPFVLVKNLGNDASEMELCVYTHKPENQAIIFSELNNNIRDLFEANGVEMAVPRIVNVQS
ncbi:MAG: mechanosensitive ion channel family protein [Fibromonadales bacterium]|nr:mechanosensitive ion channel family protein [Fibromonadales bacterium]